MTKAANYRTRPIKGAHRNPVPQRTNLIGARMRAGLSRPELARLIGVNRTTIFRIEQGYMHPSPKLIANWTQALGEHGSLEIWDLKTWRPDLALLLRIAA